MTKLSAHQMGDLGIDSLNRGPGHHLSKALAKMQAMAGRLPGNLRHFDFLRSSVSHFTLLITSLFLIMFFGLLWTKFKSDYYVALRHAEETTQSAGTLARANLNTLFGGTASLLELIDRSSQAMPTRELATLADQAAASSANIHRILIVDPMGRLLNAGTAPLSPAETRALNAATTSNWAQRKAPAHAVFPSLLDPASSGQDAYFSLSTKLTGTDGAERFAIALISRQAVNAFLTSSALTSLPGRTGTVSLVTSEGKIHSVYPQTLSGSQIIALEDVIARSKPGSETLNYIDLSSGSFLFARRATGYGADIVVLVPMADAMANLRRSWPFLAGFAAVAILFALAFASFLTRQVHRVENTDHLLEQSEMLFELAATSAKCGLWNWSLDKEEMFWSSSIMQLLGFDSRGASLTFNQALNLVHPSDRKYLRRVEASMRNGQAEFDTKFRLKHADGHFLWMRARGEVKIAQGQNSSEKGARRFFGIMIDMTDELMATAREEQAKINLQSAIENISDAFVLWDPDQSQVLSNSKFEDWKPFNAQTAWQALDEDQEIEQPDGRWIQLKSNRISGGGVVTLARDISDFKMKNAALEESRSALNDTIKDLRTSRSHLRVLAEKFEEEKRRAEEANRSKTEFLANMSHELRTPLNAIIGFSEIMETGMFGPLGDDRYNEYAGDIRKSGRNLLELINDILDMSRIESGKYQVECEELKTGEMIDDCLRIIEARAAEKEIEIDNTIDLVPEVYADRGAFKHVLMNVMSNAVKFNTRGGHVSISSAADLETVTISIRDNGIGIAEGDLKKLGTPFLQFENHKEKRHAGSGLGIAISMSLIDLMEGILTIESEEGTGTLVSITLPRREQAALDVQALSGETRRENL